jgi:N-formylglutamate amidohydrolase
MPDSAPYRLFSADNLDCPLLISVPHAGRDYPDAVRKTTRLHDAQLRLLEDRHADALTERATQMGIPAIIATTPRTWIDLNRSEQEIDPGLVDLPAGVTPLLSTKVNGGLGLIPRRLGGRDIWRGRISAEDLATRLARHHRPYHEAIEARLRAARSRFHNVVLLDVHSMPTLSPQGENPPMQIVIGDCFGRSAHDRFTRCAAAVASDHGFRTAINHPYAGGHILNRHSRPGEGRHGLQIEVDRSLYLDAAHDHTGQGLAPLQRMIAELAMALIAEASAYPAAIAAE